MVTKKQQQIKALFVDIGGVLLTNGWDRQSREAAAKKFKLDFAEMDGRHRLTFDTYEIGKITLEEYLNRVIFFKPRDFTMEAFIKFMHVQSKAYPEMIELVTKLKKKYGLKVVVVSNEGRELTEYRIKKFGLDKIVDFFVSSCFVHVRKPDDEMYRLALDLAQVLPEQIAYLEDREMFVQIAEWLGIHGVLHIDHKTTLKKLAALGLK
jgi:putative hydrolase of the HAD superfamily